MPLDNQIFSHRPQSVLLDIVNNTNSYRDIISFECADVEKSMDGS